MPFYKVPRLIHPRAIYPAKVNQRSQQSRGLTGWWPLGFGGGSEGVGSHTRDTKTRAYSALSPRTHDLVDQASDTDDNYRPYFVADPQMGAAARLTANFTQFSSQAGNTWATYITAATSGVSSWFRPRANPGSTGLGSIYLATSTIFSDRANGYHGVVYSNHNGGGTQIHGFNYDGSEDVVSYSVSLDTWYHIFFRHASGTIYLYVNGIVRASTASGNTQSLAGPPQIGTYASNPVGYDVADLRTYNQDVPPEIIYQMWHPATRWELYQEDSAFYFVPAATADLTQQPHLVLQAVNRAATY